MQKTEATPLFKYMRRHHAHRLLAEGRLRIGTLHEYRNTEKHGSAVGDAHEGTKGATLTVPYLQAKSTADLPDFVRERIRIGEGSTTIFVNCTFSTFEESPDFYIYSATRTYDPNAMSAMGYDTCIQISNPQMFFRAISHTLRHKGEFQGLSPCVYMPRHVHPDEQHDIHPALIKDPNYFNQNEERAIWRPLSPHPRPVIITCRKASRWCTLVS